MQTSTGEIGMFKDEDEAKKRGFDKMLTPKEYEHVKPMNRAKRRAWAKEQRKKA